MMQRALHTNFKRVGAWSLVTAAIVTFAGVAATPAAALEGSAVANDDAYTAKENAYLHALPSVLANDRDTRWANGTPMYLSAQLVTGTTNGSLQFRSDGTFIYLSNLDFNGTDSFTYRAVDSWGIIGSSNVATVTITVAPNDPPVANADFYETSEDTRLFAWPGVLANDTDPDGDYLSVQRHFWADGPANGRVSVDQFGSFVYDPNAGFYGLDTFTYRAFDGAAYSNLATVTITVHPVADAPEPPTGVSATPGNGEATVTWTAPADGGSPITGYTVTSAPGGFTCTTATTSCVVTGLTNGTAYTFTVVAQNSAGVSSASAATAPATPRTVPDAPTDVTVTPGNGEATVTWTAPADGGSPITGYTVTSAPGGFTCTTATTSCVVTGLTNGTAYTFTVVAQNSAGASSASAASTPATPRTVPDAPTNVTGKPGKGQVIVSWAPPMNNGGAAVIDYTVTLAPGGLTCTTTSTSCAVAGTTNGTAYTFTVTARNAAGSSAPSTAGSLRPSRGPSAGR